MKMAEEMKEKLMLMYGYSDYTAGVTAHNLVDLAYPDLRAALHNWVKNSECTVIREDAHNTDYLMKYYKMTYPAALIFIDWYRQDPVNAKKSLIRV